MFIDADAAASKASFSFDHRGNWKLLLMMLLLFEVLVEVFIVKGGGTGVLSTVAAHLLSIYDLCDVMVKRSGAKFA